MISTLHTKEAELGVDVAISALKNHDPTCDKCGHPKSNHPYRHPFVAAHTQEDI